MMQLKAPATPRKDDHVQRNQLCMDPNASSTKSAGKSMAQSGTFVGEVGKNKKGEIFQFSAHFAAHTAVGVIKNKQKHKL